MKDIISRSNRIQDANDEVEAEKLQNIELKE